MDWPHNGADGEDKGEDGKQHRQEEDNSTAGKQTAAGVQRGERGNDVGSKGGRFGPILGQRRARRKARIVVPRHDFGHGVQWCGTKHAWQEVADEPRRKMCREGRHLTYRWPVCRRRARDARSRTLGVARSGKLAQIPRIRLGFDDEILLEKRPRIGLVAELPHGERVPARADISHQRARLRALPHTAARARAPASVHCERDMQPCCKRKVTE
mmetsp:Transcript_8791/g.19548  ORF Transcript_8791/g.19548 Transcript_8791/m.19548 type:complete len:213 (-) Transcript_8791:341-979(-)